MRNRIKAVIFAAAIAMVGSLAARAESLCGQRINDAKHQTVVSCVDYDKFRALIPGFPLSGTETQALVEPVAYSAVAVRVTFKRGEETVSLLAEPYMQPDGRRRAMVRIPGTDWSLAGVQVLREVE